MLVMISLPSSGATVRPLYPPELTLATIAQPLVSKREASPRTIAEGGVATVIH